MKLRNKKTGGIVELDVIGGNLFFKRCDNKTDKIVFSSLAELNEEWEDYEEPKEYWYINICSGINHQEVCDNNGLEKTMRGQLQKIGNYFETKEEAEEAVKKLKAWKRLEDKGFKFTSYKDNTSPEGDSYRINIEATFNGASRYDLDLLFGEEDE